MYTIKTNKSIKVIMKNSEKSEYHLKEFYLPGKPSSTVILNKHDKLTVNLQGVELEVTAEWLFCYAKLKIQFPKEYVEHVKDLELFIPNNPGSAHYANTSPKAYFKNPIRIEHYLPAYRRVEEFRMIPYSPTYAISQDGYILDLINDKINIPALYEKRHDYVKHELRGVQFRHHILVASAWCINYDKQECIEVDHINGIRNDNRAVNLRWVTRSENQRNAYNTGYATTTPCVVKNLVTGEVKHYVSLAEASRDMDRGYINTKNVNLKTGKPYIIKKNGEWYQMQFDLGVPVKWVTLEKAQELYNTITRDRYSLTIKSKTDPDEIYTYCNLDEISKFINDGKKYISLNEAISAIERTGKYVAYKKSIISNNELAYIARNLETGEILYANSTTPLITATGVTKSSIRKSAFFNGKYKFNNWVFKVDDGTEFDESEMPPTRRMHIIADNGRNRYEFNSMREMSRYFNIAHGTIQYCIKNGLDVNGYKIQVTRE
jgi:NUMOD1 domain